MRTQEEKPKAFKVTVEYQVNVHDDQFQVQVVADDEVNLIEFGWIDNELWGNPYGILDIIKAAQKYNNKKFTQHILDCVQHHIDYVGEECEDWDDGDDVDAVQELSAYVFNLSQELKK